MNPGGVHDALDPQGPGAAAIAELWWILLAVTGSATLLTFLVIVLALWRRRTETRSAGPAQARREWIFVFVAGGVIPSVLIFVLLIASFRTGARVSVPAGETALVVQVTGHMFWWEVVYPGHGIRTANEIHVPAGVPIELEVRSADVIHSFWVPSLHGKIDMIPGHRNRFWLQADRPGTYRGLCAEFCGLQHARMAFLFIALPPDEFESWAARLSATASGPEAAPAAAVERGRTVFLDRGCGTCHVFRGLSERGETGDVGPDLTHFAERRTIGAATIANTPENLARWITEPDLVKPGSRMPATRLEADELDALLALLGKRP